MDSVSKVIKFWEDHGSDLAGNAPLAAMAFPMIRGQVEGKDPAELDQLLAQFAALILSLRSDGATPLGVGQLADEPSNPAAAHPG